MTSLNFDFSNCHIGLTSKSSIKITSLIEMLERQFENYYIVYNNCDDEKHPKQPINEGGYDTCKSRINTFLSKNPQWNINRDPIFSIENYINIDLQNDIVIVILYYQKQFY